MSTENVTSTEEIPVPKESEESLDGTQSHEDVSNHTSTNVSTPSIHPEVVEASTTESELSGTTKFQKENDSLNVWRKNVSLVQLQSLLYFDFFSVPVVESNGSVHTTQSELADPPHDAAAEETAATSTTTPPPQQPSAEQNKGTQNTRCKFTKCLGKKHLLFTENSQHISKLLS